MIKEVTMHQNPHWDEVVAYFILSQYGEHAFPGASNMFPIRFVESDPIGGDEEYDKDGILPIGCGGGRFDEHRAGIERLKDECSATLVAKYLGVIDKPELKRLLKETLHFDTHEGCAPTQLPEILKRAHRTTRDNYEVMDWALFPLAGMVRQEKYHYAKTKGEKSLIEVMNESVAQGLYTEEKRVLKYMTDIMRESEQAKDDSITELAHVLQSLYRNGYTEEQVSNWLVTPMDATEQDQSKFFEEVKRCAKQGFLKVQAKIRGKEGTLKLLVRESDSPHAQKAARYVGADLVLVRNSRKNIQIHANKKIRGLALTNAVCMIRWLELPRDKKNVPLKELGYFGEKSESDHWYYFKKGEMFFNGTLTKVTRPSRLKTEIISDVLLHAFHPDGIKNWCKRYKISEAEVEDAPLKKTAA